MSAYASQFGYFFDSISGDRTYNSESCEDWLKPFFVSGVFNGDLQVTAQETPDMTVNVAPGRANLDGKLAKWTGTNVMTLSPASGVYDRIDTIVLRRDNVNRRISIEVVTGAASLNPSPTAPVRNVDTYELVIAQILVGVGVTSISQANITDTRMNSDVCGWVVATVDQIDFDQIKAQFDGWMADTEQAYNEWKSGVEDDLEEWETNTKGDFTDWEDGVKSDFDDWFDAIKDQLDSDAAGHLQLEIDALSGSIGGKANKVANAVSGNVATLDSSGDLVDSRKTLGVSVPAPGAGDSGKFLRSDGTWETVDISGKADKVSGATTGHFAGLDSNGNLTDSGKSAGSFAAPATAASGTAAAGSWSSATPPTQDVSVTGVTANSTIIVSIASTATSAQIDAAAAGKLLCTAQGAGTITLTCYGTEPSVNIPLTVLILG